MLNMNEVMNKGIVRDNEIAINGTVIGKLSDDEAKRIMSIVSAMIDNKPYITSNTETSKKVSKTLSIPDEKVPSQPVQGTVLYQTDFITVTNYKDTNRLYIHVPYTVGKKADGIRYAIKETAKKYGSKWAGNKKYGIYYWTLDDVKGFIAEQKKYDAEHRKEKA